MIIDTDGALAAPSDVPADAGGSAANDETAESSVEQAIAFLALTYPEGPWCLTAIDPDRKAPIETRTFVPANATDCHGWLKARLPTRNLYWHVNPVRRPLTKRAERTDIKSVAYLHVDVDPEPGHDLAEQQQGILERFSADLPSGVPAPTYVIFSGGGYQAFWRLKEPIPIDGDIEKAEDAKRYNQQLERLFGGNNCHNIDRVMRLPFTVNLPDAKKLAKGRRRAVTRVVISEPDRIYSVDLFLQAPASSSPGKTGAGQGVGNEPTSIQAIATLDELDQWQVPDRIKVIIADGRHPDPDQEARKNDKTRSAWLFDAVCGLLRCGVPDGRVVGIITDARWAISASVIEKKAGAFKYAVRQVRQARMKLGAPEMTGAIVVNDPVAADVRRAIEKVFIASDLKVFRQDKRLVRVSVVEKKVERDGIVRHPGLVELAPVTGIWLADKASELGTFAIRTAKNDLRRVAPTRDHMAALLEITDESRFPAIKGLSLTPTLRCDKPGYDEQSQLYLAFPEGLFPTGDLEPSRPQAQDSLKRLLQPLRAFPFVDGAARSVALSALLSAVVRGELRTCPLHGFDAPAAGTGKTKLAIMAGILALGVDPPSVTFGEDADENQKQLSSLLMTGCGAILLDNVEVPLKGAFINGILTKDGFDTRILGVSKMVRLNTRALLMATGNNLRCYGDMARRAVFCRMDAKMPNPEDRQFDFDAEAEVRQNRCQLVVDALTVLRGYIAAGTPVRLPSYGSFEDWDLVRGALVWLGETDPLETKALVSAMNPKQEERAELIALLFRHCGAGRKFKIADIEAQSDEDRGTLKSQFGTLLKNGRWHKGEAGQLLTAHKDVSCMGLTLVAKQNRVGVNEWWLEGVAAQELVDEVGRHQQAAALGF